MNHFQQVILICFSVLVLSSCSVTKQLTIHTIEPSPVDFSSQIKKIGIVNSSHSALKNTYSTRLEQLLVLEERWLAKNGTQAALTGLFDKLILDQRFDTVLLVTNASEEMKEFGAKPNLAAWNRIATICKENDVDAIFALASHEAETTFSLKRIKIAQYNMLRDRSQVVGQEITLETFIENGWRIYDPKQRKLIDEFTSDEQIIATAKGASPIAALQAIDQRRETLLTKSKNSGVSYAQRMQPQQFAIERNYYAKGSSNFKNASTQIQEGNFDAARKLWEEEIENPKTRLRSRACYNLAVLNEFNTNLEEAMRWAKKSYLIVEDDSTLDYIKALEQRQAQTDVLKEQLVNAAF